MNSAIFNFRSPFDLQYINILSFWVIWEFFSFLILWILFSLNKCIKLLIVDSFLYNQYTRAHATNHRTAIHMHIQPYIYTHFYSVVTGHLTFLLRLYVTFFLNSPLSIFLCCISLYIFSRARVRVCVCVCLLNPLYVLMKIFPFNLLQKL